MQQADKIVPEKKHEVESAIRAAEADFKTMRNTLINALCMLLTFSVRARSVLLGCSSLPF